MNWIKTMSPNRSYTFIAGILVHRVITHNGIVYYIGNSELGFKCSNENTLRKFLTV